MLKHNPVFGSPQSPNVVGRHEDRRPFETHPMRMTIALIGSIALAAACLAVTAGYSQQPPKTPVQAPAPRSKAAAPEPSKPAAPVPVTASSSEEKAILERVEGFTKAYSAANVQAMVDFFHDDSSIVEPGGAETRGKGPIAEMYTAAFQDTPGLKLESTVEEIKFLTPDVAKVSGQSRLTNADGNASEYTRFNSLMVRRDGKWRIDEIREQAAPAEDITAYERLKELEWMVGDWVDESENNKVSASIRWADGQSYLIRDYAIQIQGERAASGTMFIGWDPQSGQIKSWVFDSTGGHGEALWTRTGDKEWVVKAQGVLRDGRPTSATQIHTILNKDSVKTSSIDRIIGGTVAPDITDIVMVRKPPRSVCDGTRSQAGERRSGPQVSIASQHVGENGSGWSVLHILSMARGEQSLVGSRRIGASDSNRPTSRLIATRHVPSPPGPDPSCEDFQC